MRNGRVYYSPIHYRLYPVIRGIFFLSNEIAMCPVPKHNQIKDRFFEITYAHFSSLSSNQVSLSNLLPCVAIAMYPPNVPDNQVCAGRSHSCQSKISCPRRLSGQSVSRACVCCAHARNVQACA